MNLKINSQGTVKIREMANDIYVRSQKIGLVSNPDKDWLEAESIYNNMY